MEGYSPFVVSLLWAFFSSISRPSDIKSGYILMSVCSKLGALTTILGTLWLLSAIDAGELALTSAATAQLLLAVASVLLLLVPLIITVLMRTVPKSHLHGYEAVYRFEKAREKKGLYEGLWGSIRSLFDGLYVFFRFPYMLGIFGMIFFWEVLNVTCNIIRLGVGEAATHSPIAFLSYLYEQVLYVNIVGLVVVLVGTRTLVSLLGERRSLIAIPVLTGIALAYYMAFQTAAAATIAYVVMRAINYALAFPLRESLYIPTTKAMKFKSKSWIDGFGSKIAKGAGGYYSWIAQHVSPASVFSLHMVFFAGVIGATCCAIQL
jgi:ATP:ADP antiporter, AAA family